MASAILSSEETQEAAHDELFLLSLLWECIDRERDVTLFVLVEQKATLAEAFIAVEFWAIEHKVAGADDLFVEGAVEGRSRSTSTGPECWLIASEASSLHLP